MTTGEVIQRVQSLYSKGVQSQSSRLTPRHIYSALLTARSILLRQQANKGQNISQWTYETLPCVELIVAPVHECPCVPSGNCYILRSKHKLPKPISGLEGVLIQSVTSLDGTMKFDEDTFENMKYGAGNKFTSTKPGYYVKNGYLYVVGLSLLKVVTVSGLFEDFVEVKSFPSICGTCEECECGDIMDIEFPIDGDLIRPLLQIANEELIILFKQMKEDKTNDASDSSSTNGAMVHQPNNQQE